MGPDRRLAVILLTVSAGYLAATFLITEPEGEYATVGPRAFPLVIGIALAVCAAWIGLRRTARGGDLAPPAADSQDATERRGREDRRGVADPPGSAGSDGHADPDQQGSPAWRAAAPAAAAFLAYIALLAPAGYLLATAVFIPLEARLLGSRSWRRDLIAGLVITAAIYAVLGVLLGFRLPAGVFG